MFAVLVLHLPASTSSSTKREYQRPFSFQKATEIFIAIKRGGAPPAPQQTDYFNLRIRPGGPVASPIPLSRQPSSPSSPVTVSMGQSLGSSSSSRGSWSSLFNAGPVRHLIGVANEQAHAKHSASEYVLQSVKIFNRSWPDRKANSIPFQKGKRIVFTPGNDSRAKRSSSRKPT